MQQPEFRRRIVQALEERIERIAQARRKPGGLPVSTGCRPLDRLLPAGGLVPGSLVEWLGAGPGSGAGTLALLAAREAAGEARPWVVIDRRSRFYPPAVRAWGIDERQIVLVRPGSDADEAWAFDQVLRCGQIAAVLHWPDRLDSRTFRRLQLAAESSGCLGLLVRPAAVRGQPSWADVRWLVRPRTGGAGRRLAVELLRSRGGRAAETVVELEIDEVTGSIHEADPLHLAPRLAPAAPGAHPARA